jgi:multidrug resistance efflux pump
MTKTYVPPADLELAKRDLDQSTRQVEQLSAAVATAEKSWRELNPDNADIESPRLKSALAVAEQKLLMAEAQLQPVSLVAPIDGCISKLDKLAGTTVVDGDSIATIANQTSDRIIGYLSQPLRLEPKIGMKAEIRSRGLTRTIGETQITAVGPRIELFDAPLRVRGMGSAQERGLPIVMAIPSNMHIRPGELVDIRLLTN